MVAILAAFTFGFMAKVGWIFRGVEPWQLPLILIVAASAQYFLKSRPQDVHMSLQKANMLKTGWLLLKTKPFKLNQNIPTEFSGIWF